MKLHTQTNTVTKSENFTESNYSIDATAKAFAILSDGLYSNKILAVVRELSTNAYDSHVAAGCAEKPFDVKLPTSLELEFSVRDYGTGLSKEDCMSLYTTYFRSDKTDSNDAVGCLGLGSKSPFAYTDQFMVESFYDGSHMTFSAYKNENDEPVFALLSEQETEEPNGLKVSFATEHKDTTDFRHEAQKVWQYFTTVPNANIEIEVVSQGDAIMSGDDWQIANKVNRYAQNVIVMGQIAYELDEDQFEGDVHDLLYRCHGLIIFANIGDVDITPSRESLSYNSRTKEFLHNKLAGIVEEISTETQSYVDDLPTLWDARTTFINMHSSMGGVKVIQDAISEIKTYNGQKLFSEDVWCGVELPESTKAGNDVVQYSKSKWRAAIERKEISTLKVFSSKHMTIIYENEKKCSVGRVRHYLKEDRGEGNVFLIRGSEEYLQEVITCLGGNREHVLDVTTLPKPPSKGYASRSSYSGGYKRCEVLKYDQDEKTWRSSEASVSVKEENVFFLESSRDDYFLNGKSMHLHTLRSVLDSLSEIGADMDILDGKIYVFTPSTVKSMKLHQRPNWTDASETLTTEIRYQLDKNKSEIVTYENSDKNGWSCGNKGYDISIASLKGIYDKCETHGELGCFMSIAKPDLKDGVVSLVSSAKKVNIYENFCENLGLQVVDFDDKYDTIVEYYPMLKVVKRWLEEDEVTMVAEYVDNINRGAK